MVYLYIKEEISLCNPPNSWERSPLRINVDVIDVWVLILEFMRI